MIVFISHATADKPFVMELHNKLAEHGIGTWIDARELTGGDALEPEIEQALGGASMVLVVLSPNTINSTWVTQEVQVALKLQQERGKGYKVIPLMLPGITHNGLRHWFPNGPLGISMEIGPGELDEAMPHILAALGERLPTYIPPAEVKPPIPVAELILELTDPAIFQGEGKRRATATATLIYQPAEATARDVRSARYRITAPLGPIETGELAWYLEHYWRWPISVYKERAEGIEKRLPEWGKLLYRELRNEVARQPLAAWEAAAEDHERRFTVRIDRELTAGSSETAQVEANEAATLLLAIPWELLHDDRGYLFQGAKGVRVRRQLPNRFDYGGYTTLPPIRVLLVSPRPQDDRAAYIDHRVSARPLVEALSPLGDLAQLTLLSPPTFDALTKELVRAREEGTPYHVVHFDGHGVYDKQHGLGMLCFEDPQDARKPVKRRSLLVDAEQIASAIRDCRVPLFFLEACQSAKSDDPTASVAGKLLEGGVASVIAMTHSVLVETARRFVETFYWEALSGARIGQAMRKGQQALKDDDWRLKTFAGDLRLQDWFVPVLYQEKSDPQLVAGVPNETVQAQMADGFRKRLGKLPDPPPQTFVGRSQELLCAERMLEHHKHIVIQGQGGEGKTTLACELARWLVQTRRYIRTAFVSFDQALTAAAALSLLGDQLVPNYQSKAGQGENRGWLEVQRALTEQPTVIVLDNLETVLHPKEGSLGAAAFEPKTLEEILALCGQLQQAGKTRLVFTSREPLPDPFQQNTIRLGSLSKPEAIDLVAKTLGEGNWLPEVKSEQENDEAIEQLVEAAGYHARALVLLTKEIRRSGVKNATEHFTRLMQQMEQAYPGERENSLLASVKLSLDRLPSETRKRIRPFGVFQGGASAGAIKLALQIEDVATVQSIGRELVEVGLAEDQGYGYLRFDPALTAVLLSEMSVEEQTAARDRWAETMQALARLLYQLYFTDPQGALGLTARELPNLLAALEHRAGTAEAAGVVEFAICVEPLAQALGRVAAVARASRLREAAARKLGDWSHVAFNAAHAAIDRLLDAGRFGEAVASSERLLQRCELAGETAYPGAAYDLAMAHFTLGHAQRSGGASGIALGSLDEAERRFSLLAEGGDQNAGRMASTARTEKADCLRNLGRLEEAAGLYEQTIQDDEQRGDLRSAAVGRSQLGTVRGSQRRYQDALQAFTEARETFERLSEPQPVADAWHNIGIVYKNTGDYPSAERAYQEALQLKRLYGSRSGQADSLGELGSLYERMNRHEEAMRFFGEAAAIHVELRDGAKEGIARNNMAISLIQLQRYEEARRELERTIVCKAPFGHAAELWTTYAILHDLEKAVGKAAAAREAREQAMQLYLAYRRDGGESQDVGGRVVAAFVQALAEGQAEPMAAQLTELLNDPEMPDIGKPLLRALLRVLAGERDPALADDPNLTYLDAVELRLLLERLG